MATRPFSHRYGLVLSALFAFPLGCQPPVDCAPAVGVERAAQVARIAQVEPGETMRLFFEQQGALFHRIRPGDGYSAHVLDFVPYVPEGCKIRGAADQPSVVTRGVVSTYYVAFPRDRETFCAHSPDQAFCESLQDNCRTTGSAIFCDISFTFRLESEARAVYQLAHGASAIYALMGNPTAVMPTFADEVYETLAKFHEGMRAFDDPTLAPQPPLLTSANDYAHKFPSVSRGIAEDIVLLQLYGHEFAHIEQNLCPAGELNLTDSQIKILDAYEELVCAKDPEQRRELAADLRGIELAMRVQADHIAAATERNYGIPLDEKKPRSATPELRAVQSLDANPSMLMRDVFINSQEYEAVFESMGTRAWSLFADEPKELESATGEERFQAHAQYWMRASIQHWSELTAKHPGNSSLGYVPPSLRVFFAVAALHKREKVAKVTAVGNPGGRIHGVAAGELIGIQAANCGRTATEASKRIDAFFDLLHVESDGPAMPAVPGASEQ